MSFYAVFSRFEGPSFPWGFFSVYFCVLSSQVIYLCLSIEYSEWNWAFLDVRWCLSLSHCRHFSPQMALFSMHLQSYQRLLLKLEQIFLKKANEEVYLICRVHLVTLKLHCCLREGEHWLSSTMLYFQVFN